MRLDATDLRYVSQEEFKVLSAVEVGSKNHEVVPTPLIAELSSIRSGIVTKCLQSLAKRGLVARVQGAKYDGYRLTYGGLDYLALRTFSRRQPASVAAVGKKIGVGKESDIHVVKDEAGKERVLKIHRLGRISFRAVKEKRDYLGKRKSASWMYLSRLAAQKEFAFMQVLHKHGFPVPIPIDQARHCIVMSLIDSYPLRQVEDIPSPSDLYSTLMSLLLRLAHSGLIHGDFNEFNILIHRKTGEPTLIDFPQMISTRHPNAEFQFDRDVECIKHYFLRRFRYEPSTWPRWKDVLAGPLVEDDGDDQGGNEAGPSSSSKMPARTLPRLDEEVEASGWKGSGDRQLEEYLAQMGEMPEPEGEIDEEEDEDDEEEDEDDEERGDENGEESQSLDDPRVSDEAFKQNMANRLEALRLSRALGNDEDEPGLKHDANALEDLDDESSSEESEDGDDEGTPVVTDKTSRPSGRQNGEKDMGARIAQEMGNGRRQGNGRTNGGRANAGKGKGHKWKTSEKYLVGKSSGW